MKISNSQRAQAASLYMKNFHEGMKSQALKAQELGITVKLPSYGDISIRAIDSFHEEVVPFESNDRSFKDYLRKSERLGKIYGEMEIKEIPASSLYLLFEN